MQPESDSRSALSPRFSLRSHLKGSAALIVAIAVVAILLVALPAYRWFFLISVLVGVVIACALALYHKLHPIEEQDVEHKHPLGL